MGQGPGIVKGIFGSFRGYAGNISAAGALDAISNDGNTLLIDIRCCSEYGNKLSIRAPPSHHLEALLQKITSVKNL